MPSINTDSVNFTRAATSNLNDHSLNHIIPNTPNFERTTEKGTMEHLDKGDYANGDPVEAVYYTGSKTFVYRTRSKLVDEDAGSICTSRVHLLLIGFV